MSTVRLMRSFEHSWRNATNNVGPDIERIVRCRQNLELSTCQSRIVQASAMMLRDPNEAARPLRGLARDDVHLVGELMPGHRKMILIN